MCGFTKTVRYNICGEILSGEVKMMASLSKPPVVETGSRVFILKEIIHWLSEDDIICLTWGCMLEVLVNLLCVPTTTNTATSAIADATADAITLHCCINYMSKADQT